MSEPLRAGIIGAGFIGAVHARAVRTLGQDLAAVAASTPARSRAAAAELGARSAVDSAEELAAAPGIDVVHICTPNALHAPLTRIALDAGKHVVLEKPVGMSGAEVAGLVRRWRDTDRVVAVPFAYRFYPVVREVRERVRGERIRLIHGVYLQDWLSRDSDTNWRVRSELGGPSRAFGDIGVHWCDLAEFVTGQRIARVHAVLPRVVPVRAGAEVDTEDAALLQFETEQGVFGSAVISQISPGRRNQLQLRIDTPEVEYAFDQQEPEILWMGRRDETRVLHRGDPALGPDATSRNLVPAGHPQGYLDSFTGFIADTYATIRGEKPEGLPTLADGARATAITEAVLSSATRRDWVEVTPG
ncbi:Gfo/Idh/MocA family oxidoreductase [Amycolatopsis thermalba]|uniref:Gfo/Idh/MocA family oxidoreductase n=1 Tax=Amycolatopsis thermalba TaxID=944492 RepID=A0ABY4P0A8_9PSEU|nr:MULTISPECIES: Gfo/Idh/MocA family oxidoreductase [Amycolatopsis]OXM65115.1 oxidoreductase [Amycolatopsis sp. KNN50.9b]UQS25688.1 Gfo/Idh/MocA family oxidoreductase [Amycolatopsis thermalba]